MPLLVPSTLPSVILLHVSIVPIYFLVWIILPPTPFVCIYIFLILTASDRG